MSVNVTLVGGPTVVLEVAGLRVITDPTFDPPQTYPPAPGSADPELVKTAGPALSLDDLPPVDVALVSHEHADNLDNFGRAFLKGVAHVFTTRVAAERVGDDAVGLDDFESATVPLPSGSGLTVTAVPAHHGPDGIWQAVGPVVGFVLSGQAVPTIYVSGDNTSMDVVREVSEKLGPFDLAVLFVGGAQFPALTGDAYLTMSNQMAVETARIMQGATVVPAHADSWTHLTQTAEQLRELFAAEGMADRIVVVKPGASADVTV